MRGAKCLGAKFLGPKKVTGMSLRNIKMAPYVFIVIGSVHRGSSSICWVLVRDLAIDMHFLGVIGFLCIKNTP